MATEDRNSPLGPRPVGGPAAEEKTEKWQEPRGGNEVVLVVDDDPAVRDGVCHLLQSLGYRTIEAPDVSSARSVLAEDNDIDVILSDIILPGRMSGAAFAEEVKQNHPELKLILMSGYSADQLDRGNAVVSETVFLRKPFDIRQLADALREVLD